MYKSTESFLYYEALLIKEGNYEKNDDENPKETAPKKATAIATHNLPLLSLRSDGRTDLLARISTAFSL
ncbi:hypothetical protein [Brevibacillus brevis]|uniref:hypothetical protein n=1 Tax=Brevibacillus brevis TaxID=1393 RepID=UPI001477829E|nr:hypothetical protein [Brevibacillus brevis]